MDLESLLCSPAGFNLNGTLVQRAICRAVDGKPLDDLLARGSDFERRCVETAIGCAPSLLPTGAPPTEIVDLEPVRCGKSLRMAALAVARTQTIDVSAIKAGEEPPRISILATQLDQASTIRGHLNIVNERPALRSLKVGDDADSITLLHPSGMPIQIRVIAAARGGYTLASRWSGSVLFDEAPGWYSTDRIVSLEESRDQALSRLLPGAQNYFAGSKWQPAGFCFEAHTEHFGQPTPELVVISPQAVDGVSPATQLNPVYWTPERIERVRAASPRSFSTHIQNLFGSAQNSAFDFEDVNAAFRPLEAGYAMAEPMGFVDFSDLSSPHGDATVLCIASPMVPTGETIYQMQRGIGGAECVARDEYGYEITLPKPTKPLLRVHEIHAWQDRIPMDQVVAEQARILKRWGARQAAGDQRSDTALAALFSQHSIRYFSTHWTNENKHDAVQAVARSLAARELSFCDSPKMREQLLAYGYRLIAGGRFQYQGRGRNDDHVAALLSGQMFLASPEALALSSYRPRGLQGDPRRAHRGYRTEVEPR